MKKLFSKSSTIALALSMATILLALPSCKTIDSSQLTVDSFEVQKFRSVDTVVVRDSVMMRDSVVLRERTIHDTVYITKEVYRDALNSKFKIQNSTKADTVVVTEWREKVIEHPPERYVPKFYRWCTVLLFALLAWVAVRWWLRTKRYFLNF